MQQRRTTNFAGVLLLLTGFGLGAAPAAEGPGATLEDPAAGEIGRLREQVARQQEQIDQLRLALEEQGRTLESLLASRHQAPAVAAKFSATPVAAVAQPASQAAPKLEDLAKRTEELSRSLAGFRFSGRSEEHT